MHGSPGRPLLWFSLIVFARLVRGLAGRAVAPVLLMVYSPLSCAARQDGRCSSFSHGIRFLSCEACLEGHALVSLMVCFPLVHNSSRQPLLQFRSLCLPPFARGPLGWPLLWFRSWCDCPFSCMAHWDGCCSSFHSCCSPLALMAIAPVFACGVFARLWCVCPLHARLAGKAVAPVLLMPAVALVFFFYSEVASVFLHGGYLGDRTVALVSPMGLCVATLCCACLLAHCLARCCARCTARGQAHLRVALLITLCIALIIVMLVC